MNRDYEDLEKQVDKWVESIDVQSFCEDNREGRESSLEQGKPGYNFLSEKNKETYCETMMTFIDAKMKKNNFLRGDELRDLILKKLLERTNPNSEFDFIFFKKVYTILFTNLLLSSSYLSFSAITRSKL